MLDLSHNNISGPIPHCLGNIMQNPWDTDVYDSSSFGYGDFEMFGGNTLIDVDDSFETTSTISFPNSFGALVGIEFTTKYNTYSYEGSILSYMFGVDLTGMTPQRTAQFALLMKAVMREILFFVVLHCTSVAQRQKRFQHTFLHQISPKMMLLF